VLSLVVLGLWSFPRFWYTKTDRRQGAFWLAEQKELSGWQYTEVPVSQAAEAALAADRIASGEYRNQNGALVRVFSVKRYAPTEGEFDMFSHTPDRCWTSVGWTLEQATPEFVEVIVQGLAIKFERRIFLNGAHRELVYFGALVGGQPLPYRLDQYLSIGVKRAEKPPPGIFGKMLGAIDARYLRWPWKSFVNRRPLTGPKQFIRLSTPTFAGDPGTADATLADFLPRWLSLADYRTELEQWTRARK